MYNTNLSYNICVHIHSMKGERVAVVLRYRMHDFAAPDAYQDM
jgi:hypothetical protein